MNGLWVGKTGWNSDCKWKGWPYVEAGTKKDIIARGRLSDSALGPLENMVVEPVEFSSDCLHFLSERRSKFISQV